MSVAAVIRPPASLYREEQFFAWWVYAILGGIVVFGWAALAWNSANGPGDVLGSAPILPVVGLILPPLLVLGLLRMTTDVSPMQCRVGYGFVPTYRRAIAIDVVTRVEVVSYRAVRDHWFWGVHTGLDGERTMTARGSRGVRLHLRDGSRVLVGSQSPELLAEALSRAMRPIG